MTDHHFFMELDNYPGFYYPGQTVTGRVVRIVTEPEEHIRYLRLKFQGIAVVDFTTSTRRRRPGIHDDREAHRIYYTHQNQDTYFEHVIQVNHKNDGTVITALHHGTNSFPFVFHLPVGIPASYYHMDVNSMAHSRIYYEALAIHRVKNQAEITALLNFRIERPVDLNLSPLSFQPNLLEEKKYLCCCCFRCGPISFKLTFNKTGFLVGERISFLAELVNNTSLNIEIIEVWLSRTVTFRATDGSVFNVFFEEQIGPRVRLPGLSDTQRVEVPAVFDLIPVDYKPVNSFGCSFMESFHLLHIEMTIPCSGNLDGSIPIVIGTVPFVIPSGSESETVSEGQSGTPAVMKLGNPAE